MNRYVGKHQNSAGEKPDFRDFSDNIEDSDLEYASETAFSADSSEPVSSARTAVLETVRPDASEHEGEIASEMFSGEDDYRMTRIHKSRKQKSEGKKGLSKFVRFLLIYAAVFLVLIAIGLTFFWRYIAAFEISRPEHTMDELVLTLENGEAANTLNDYFTVSEFEDKDTVFNEISGVYLEGQDFTYRKMPGEYTDSAPVYILRAGTNDVLKVNLAPKGENTAGYGFQLWDISAVKLFDKITRTLSIEVPPDAAVSVNGRALSEDYITDNHVEYENLSEYESDLSESIYRVLYTVEGIYDEAEVSVVDKNGEEMKNESDDDSEFIYDSARYSVKLVASPDDVVSLNGRELSEEDAVGTLFSSDLLKGLEKYADSVPNQVIYEVEGLLMEPEIAAKDASGQELTSRKGVDGMDIYGMPVDEELKEANTQLVTDFIKTYVSFSSNEGGNASGTFYRLAKYLLPNTETYKRTKDVTEGMMWVVGGKIEYRELKVDDFVACGKNCFICRVSLGITITAGGNERNVDSIYTLVFVRSGNSWLVGNMVAS